MIKFNNLIIKETASIKDAMNYIEKNHHRFVIITNSNDEVIAMATDGDIRRHILHSNDLSQSILGCANKNFIWGSDSCSRESIMKKLDHRTLAIPILNNKKELIDIVSRDHFPLEDEESIYVRARSPVRISFGGGGSDLTHYFSEELSGAVINTTISLHCHATLKIRSDEKVFIHSKDLNQTVSFNNLDKLINSKSDFGLIQAIMKLITPDFGFELFLQSDFPMKSGLGGSAVLSSAILGCFNEIRRDKWDNYEIAELAYQAERHYFGVDGGWQDQYATVFGGFNFMEFKMEQNIVHPLRIPPDIQLELEESIILCNTGLIHNSGEIHSDQRKQMENKDVKYLVKKNVELSYRMRNDLLRGRLLDFGKSLNDAWQLKNKFSSKISTPQIDEIYNSTLKSGALGGKLLGAGGGGYFIFYVPPFKKFDVIDQLLDYNLKISPFRFEQEGLKSWTIRESKNNFED